MSADSDDHRTFLVTNMLMACAVVLGEYRLVRATLVPELARTIVGILANDPEADAVEVVREVIRHRQYNWATYGWRLERSLDDTVVVRVADAIVAALAAQRAHDGVTG